MNISELKKRLLVCILGIPAILFLILYTQWTFYLFIALLMTIALLEFYYLADHQGFHPVKWLGVVAVNLIAYMAFRLNTRYLLIGMTLFIILSLILELFRKTQKNAIANVSVMLFGVFYISLYTSFLLLRNNSWLPNPDNQSGGMLLMWLFGCIWICDSGAYFVGSMLGKHPLFPRVSPKKTWEGAVGGFAASLLGALLLYFMVSNILSFPDAVIIGMIVGTFGQMSDLIESLFKRDAHVKDSGSFLPGHGGALDRFDSHLLIGPITLLYLFLRYTL